MVKLRLTRFGRKNYPVYRVVAIDSKRPRDGRFIEQIGIYRVMDNYAHINEEKALYWLGKGAQPTETVKSILSKQGIWEKFKENSKKG